MGLNEATDVCLYCIMANSVPLEIRLRCLLCLTYCAELLCLNLFFRGSKMLDWDYIWNLDWETTTALDQSIICMVAHLTWAAAGVTDGLYGDQDLALRSRYHCGRDVRPAGRHDCDLRDQRGDVRWHGLRRQP